MPDHVAVPGRAEKAKMGIKTPILAQNVDRLLTDCPHLVGPTLFCGLAPMIPHDLGSASELRVPTGALQGADEKMGHQHVVD